MVPGPAGPLRRHRVHRPRPCRPGHRCAGRGLLPRLGPAPHPTGRMCGRALDPRNPTPRSGSPSGERDSPSSGAAAGSPTAGQRGWPRASCCSDSSWRAAPRRISSSSCCRCWSCCGPTSAPPDHGACASGRGFSRYCGPFSSRGRSSLTWPRPASTCTISRSRSAPASPSPSGAWARRRPCIWRSVVSLAVWIGARWLRSAGAHAESWRSLGSTLLIASLALLAFYISQDVFYNGTLPTGTRYDFPAMLAWPLWLVVAVTAVRRLFPGRAVRLGAWAVFLALLVTSAPGLARNRSDRRRSRRRHACLHGQADGARRGRAPRTATAHRDHESPRRRLRGRRLGSALPRRLRCHESALPVSRLGRPGRLGKHTSGAPARPRCSAWEPRWPTPYYQPIGQFRPDLPCLSVGLSGEPLAVCSGFGRLR